VLVDEGLLQSQEIIKWCATTRDKRPYEEADEIVLLQYFVERGLALPTSDFFGSLLFHYGIQLHHVNPNSILHIAIFVHFCEAFLGVEPHFDLFCHLFHLCSIAATSKEEEGDETDDDRPMSEVIKGKSMKTSQESASYPSGAFLPDHPKGPRAAT
jgi:hypothetical protein